VFYAGEMCLGGGIIEPHRQPAPSWEQPA
jgi:hypothetical protein